MTGNLYDVARKVCHEFGMDWTDPRTGITHKAPKPHGRGDQMEKFTMVIEKWQVKPEPKWVFHSQRTVTGRQTAKRITITEGIDKRKVFDRETGAQITNSELRRGAWYRYSVKVGVTSGDVLPG